MGAQSGTFFGILLGSGAAALANGVFGAEMMHAWGWRAPFLLSAAIAIAGVVLRRRINETPAMRTIEATAKPAPIVVFQKHWRAVIRIFALTMMATIGFGMMFVYGRRTWRPACTCRRRARSRSTRSVYSPWWR